MKIISRNTVITWIAMCAAMFMTTVCVYILIGTLISSKIYEVFYYYVPFSFLIHGMVLSMVAASLWLMFFGQKKSLRFLVRFLIVLAILATLYLISTQISVIYSLVGYLRWIWSCYIAILGLGVPFSIMKEKHNEGRV